DRANIAAELRNQVPVVERIQSPGHLLRLARDQKDLRYEHGVDSDEQQPEVDSAKEVVIGVTGQLREQVVQASEVAEHHSQLEHVVQVRHNKVCVLQRGAVCGGIGDHDVRQYPNRELDKATNRPQRRHGSFNS